MSDAVPCPGCGRGYDADRFVSGRALTCACGARVGVVRRTGFGEAEPLRFAADSMLGGLARWLRALGHDTLWEAEIADPELVRRSLAEGRVLLTRDRALAADWWLDSLLFLHADAPLAQLAEVARRFPLRADALFSRCLRCNVPLEAADEAEVEARVPDAVREGQTEFRRCPHCTRVYWEGTHTARMRREIADALGTGAPPDR